MLKLHMFLDPLQLDMLHLVLLHYKFQGGVTCVANHAYFMKSICHFL